MKRFAILGAVAAMAVVVPAQAKKPAHPAHPTHPANPNSGKGKGKGKGGSCTARNEGYNARGTLVSATLTPGAKKGRYDGSLTVDVTRANHKAPTGSQTFTLSDARVHFGKGVSSTSPAAGSRVRLHGKVTVLPHGCSVSGFTPTVTVRNAELRAAK